MNEIMMALSLDEMVEICGGGSIRWVIKEGKPVPIYTPYDNLTITFE